MLEKFTPGPWYVGAMNDCLFVIDRPPMPAPNDTGPDAGNKQTKCIAKCDYPDQEGATENAHLIAAAPELYEACDPGSLYGIVDALEDVHYQNLADLLREDIKRIESARAKARGENL